MKIHRFIDNFDLSQKQLEISGDIAHQIIKVLKLEIGEKIELCDGKHISAMADIREIKNKSVIVEITQTWTSDVQVNKVTLFCSILKKENFELVVQKTTEVGVYKIIPIISARTIKTGLNLERLQKIAKEASEQSGRINVPEILEPMVFEKSLKLCKENDLNILFDGSGEPLGGLAAKWEKINIFIGPEGGWTEEEIKKARSANFKIMKLGNLTLRGETAAIISSYLVINLK